MVEAITKKERFDELKASGKVFVVDFHATWCGPCKTISPIFKGLAEKYPNITFVKVDVDEVEDVASECEINAMPTFLVFKDGVEVDKLLGASKDKLTAMVEKAADL